MQCLPYTVTQVSVITAALWRVTVFIQESGLYFIIYIISRLKDKLIDCNVTTCSKLQNSLVLLIHKALIQINKSHQMYFFTHLIYFLEFLCDGFMVAKIIAVPSVSFSLIVEIQEWLGMLIWGDVISCKFGTHFARSLE